MKRQYDASLVEKMNQRQYTEMIHGVPVIFKPIPETDDAGEMDPRVYEKSKKQLRMLKFMPTSMIKVDFSPKSLENLRTSFNKVKSFPMVEDSIDIKFQTVTAEDGYEIPIRIYQKDTHSDPKPILYFIHGGGFFAGSPDVVEELVKLIVSKFNVSAVSIDYRLAPEHPYPIGHKDCYSVLEWIYHHASEFNGNPNLIFVAGDSAGGNLTQYCSTRDLETESKMIKGQLLLYPTLNMAGIEDDYFKWDINDFDIAPKYKGLKKSIALFTKMTDGLGQVLGTDKLNDRYLSPYIMDPKGMPPTFITVGEHDSLKIECLAYAAKLKDAKVDVEVIVYKGIGHAYGDNVGEYPQSEDLANEMGCFILNHSKNTG